MKIVKYYEGVTSGTYMGRDDGFPETKRVTYDLSVDADKVRFVKEFKTQTAERYASYSETFLTDVSIRSVWANINHELLEEHRHLDRAEKMAKYEALKKELDL